MIAGPSPSRLYFCSFRFVAFLLYWSLSLFSIFIAPTLFDIKNKSKRTRFPFFFSPASDRQEALSVLYSCKGFLFHFFVFSNLRWKCLWLKKKITVLSTYVWVNLFSFVNCSWYCTALGVVAYVKRWGIRSSRIVSQATGKGGGGGAVFLYVVCLIIYESLRQLSSPTTIPGNLLSRH